MITDVLDRIVCADALTFLASLPSASVDCVVTDPPYGIDKAEWDSTVLFDWIDEAKRISPRQLIMMGNPEFIELGHRFGTVKSVIVLHARNGMTRGSIGFGNWIAVLACGDWNWKARPNHLAFNVSAKEKIPHPSPKPMAAMLRLLETYTAPNWVICDPFMGSGQTALAARQLNRHYIGCDNNELYVHLARERLAKPWQPLLLDA